MTLRSAFSRKLGATLLVVAFGVGGHAMAATEEAASIREEAEALRTEAAGLGEIELATARSEADR